MVQQRIIEKLNELSQQLARADKKAIEVELSKITPTNKTFYELRAGYSDREEYFEADLSFRALNTGEGTVSKVTFEDCFANVIRNNTDMERLKIYETILDKLLSIGTPPSVKIFPALSLRDEEKSIAFMLTIKKAIAQ